ncbi:MAG: tRNA (guanosine(37)-N1)-methyltransferase TrmD, partial [Clostridia bacterium]
MKISILSLFPEMFSVFNSSLIKRATDKNLLQINCIDIRDYSQDKHQKCDDYTFGGGAGMIMMPQPIHDAIMACDPLHNAHRIYMSPKGRTLNQKTVMELSKYEEILLLCGHYEGVDQRVIDLDIDEEISIGDYV